MKITHDKRTDALYIYLEKGKFSMNKELEEGVVLDVGTKGELLGVEILDASKYFSKQKLIPSPFVSVKVPAKRVAHRKQASRLIAA